MQDALDLLKGLPLRYQSKAKLSAINMKREISLCDLEHVTAHVAPHMSSLKGARILVTGATGFFGLWLLETFHHMNQALGLESKLVGLGGPHDEFSVICPHIQAMSDIKLIKADICNLNVSIDALLPEWSDRIDIIIHAAIHVDAKTYDRQPMPTLATGVKGTWEALEVAMRSKVKRFLFSSAGAVYGTQPRTLDRIAENHSNTVDCSNPLSAYAEGKRFAETLCSGFMKQYGMETLIVRPFAFVGPYLPLDKHFAIGNFIRDALLGKPITIHSDGSPVRSYLYAADLAIWLWTILANGKPGIPYNVGSEQAYSLYEIAMLISKVLPKSSKIEIHGDPELGLPNRYVPDTAQAMQDLGLKANITIEDAIARTLVWYR